MQNCGFLPAFRGYDADRREVSGDGIAFEYDSTGGMMKTGRNEAYETEMFRDGAGREAKRSNRVWDGEEEEWGEWETTYSLYSSVLGRVVSEADETGAKRRTFVVAGGTEIARQAYSEESEQVVGFVHRDASGLSGRSTNAGTGTASSTYASVAEEFDALGNNVGTRGHLSRPPHEGGSMPTSNDTITFDDMTLGDCTMDGVFIPCSMALRSLGSGAVDLSRSWMSYEFANRYGVTVSWVWNPESDRTPPELPPTPDGAPIQINTQQDAGQWDYYVNIAWSTSWSSQQETFSNENACTRMVNILSGIITAAVAEFGGRGSFLGADHSQLDNIVRNIDNTFSGIYVGLPLNSLANAKALGPRSVGGAGLKIADEPYGGQTGFKIEFWETNEPNNDQTHHAVTYFSGGINGMALATGLHYSRDTSEADKLLGEVSFDIGSDLRKRTSTIWMSQPLIPPYPMSVDENPRSRALRILGVANRLRNAVCN